MPSMYVNVPRLEQETKTPWWPKLYDAAAPVLKAPTSTPSSTSMRPSTKTASPPPEDGGGQHRGRPHQGGEVNAIARACARRCGEVLGEDKDLTLVFHDNGLDRIAIGGVTIATKMKK